MPPSTGNALYTLELMLKFKADVIRELDAYLVMLVEKSIDTSTCERLVNDGRKFLRKYVE